MPRKSWEIKNPEKTRAIRRVQKAKMRVKIVAWIKSYKASHPCSCGESHPSCLDFHHKNPLLKSCATAATKHLSLTKIEAESEKCIIICANCHRKGHAGFPSPEHLPFFVGGLTYRERSMPSSDALRKSCGKDMKEEPVPVNSRP